LADPNLLASQRLGLAHPNLLASQRLGLAHPDLLASQRLGLAHPDLLASQRPRRSSSRTCTPSAPPPARPPWRWSTAPARQVPRGSSRTLTLRVPSPLTLSLHLNRALKLPRAVTRRHPAAPRGVLGPRLHGRAADRARRAPGTAERRRQQPVRSHLRGRRAPPRHARPQEDALCAQAGAVALSTVR
jgi:hypothetical protein